MENTPETRYTLIDRLGDPKNRVAWSEFANIYQPLIFRICQKKGLQYADAVDATQEVLSRVSRAIERFKPQANRASFRPWLYQIARNVVTDYFRRRGKFGNDLEAQDLLELVEATPGNDETAEFRIEYQKQIFLVIAREVSKQVKPQNWKAFWKTEVERRPIPEVADELGLNAGAVYVARSRVLARLRKAAQERLNDSSEANQ
jgi:RNA polymerase sigma-70 factor (ECF subfamily)